MSNSSASIALHGPTLTLRLPEPDDAPALLELAGDPEVTRWFSWGPYTAIEQPLAYIDRLEGQRDRGEQLDFLIVHREHGPAGVTGLNEFSAATCAAWSAPGSAARFWGTGANRESKALVAHLAFAVLGMHRLGSYSNPDNVRSTKALLGVGFTPRGRPAPLAPPRRALLDVNVFGMLRDDWESARWRGVPVTVEGEPPPVRVVARRHTGPSRSQLKPRTARTVAASPHARTTARSPAWSRSDRPVTSAAREPVDDVRQRQRLGDVAEERRRVVDVVEDAGDEDHRQEDDVHVRGRGVEVGMTCDPRDAERGQAHDTPRRRRRRARPSPSATRSRRTAAGEHDERDLDRRVRDGVRRDPTR
jgi:ribosomal-protein-alanine N-acetyltransferase